jgi:hypothetical protein
MNPFFEIIVALENANKFCVMVLSMGFRNGKLEKLRFLTEKGLKFLFATTKTKMQFISFL